MTPNYRPINTIDIYFFQCGDRFHMSASAVCRRQMLTYKKGPRTERIKIFLKAVDPHNIGIQMNREKHNYEI